jgi:hypothetical protein
LLDQGVSPFYDDRKKTIPRFVMFSAAVDHDGDRYGFVRNQKGAQDEVNQRRSKALFISNSRRIIADKGAVDDVEKARSEWARPDGFIEKNPKLDIHLDDTNADLAGQMQFLQEAKNELTKFGPSLLPPDGQLPSNISGRAAKLISQSGAARLGPFILAYRGWKLRVYQAVWNCAQRYWTGERWIRVTDDQDMAQFIKLNGLDLDERGQPQLVNYLGALNVDIILDEGPDAVNMQEDTWDQMQAAMQGGTQFPPQVVIQVMNLPHSVKKQILASMQQPPDPIEQAGKQVYVEQMKADVKKTETEGLKNVGIALANAAKAGQAFAQVQADMAATTSGAPPAYQAPAVRPSGPVQGAPVVRPAADQQSLPLPFAKGLAPVPPGGYTAGLGMH